MTCFNGLTRANEYPRRVVYHERQFMTFQEWSRMNEPPKQTTAILEKAPPKNGVASSVETILGYMLMSPFFFGFLLLQVPDLTILSATYVFTVLFDKFLPKNVDKGKDGN